MRGMTAMIVAAALALGTAATAMAEPYQWTTIPFGGGGFVDGFLYHPKAPGLLYARTDVGGMYRYDAAGHRWLPLMDGFGHDDWDCMGVMSMAVDPNDPDRLYATCGLYLSDRVGDGGVARSDDRGATWTVTRLPGVKLGGNAMGRGTGERLQVDPADGNTIWLGTNQDGLWVSRDRGTSFARVPGYAQKSVSVLLIAGQTIYAGSGETGEGLFRSTDGGAAFAAVPGSPKLVPHQMAFKDGTLYVTFADGLGPWGVTDGAVWKLTGDAWADITPMKPSKDASFGYSGLDLQGDTLVVSTSDRYSLHDDIYISRDKGMTWRGVGDHATHDAGDHEWLRAYMGGTDKDSGARNAMGHWMDAVKINPFDLDELVYGTGYGVWKTNDLHGQSVDFTFDDANLEETVVLGLESPPAGPRVLMAAGDVGGAAYDDLTRTPQSGLFTPENKTNQGVVFAALAPNVVVRSVDFEDARGFISFDGARTWQPLPLAPPPLQTQDWEHHRAGKLVISAEANTMVWAPEGEVAHYSSDGGKTWTPSKGWPVPAKNIEPIADPVNDATFYAYDRQGTVFVSRDRGQTFAPLVTGLPGVTGWTGGQLRAVPGREGDLWLAVPAGLLHLVDGQAVAIPGVGVAWQVTFGHAAPGRDYPAVFIWGKVGREEGLWRSDDAGATWTRINDDARRFGNMRAIAGDPREYGVLYIAPDGRGIMVGRP